MLANFAFLTSDICPKLLSNKMSSTISTTSQNVASKNAKLVSIKIIHTDGFLIRRCTYRISSAVLASTILEMYCKSRKLKVEDYQLVYDGHILVLDNSLRDNQLNSSSKLYQVTLASNEEVVSQGLYPQRVIQK